MKRSFTTLTEATLITAVVQHGYGEIITDALLEVGIQGSTVHGAMGVGIRERLGALGVASVNVVNERFILFLLQEQAHEQRDAPPVLL